MHDYVLARTQERLPHERILVLCETPASDEDRITVIKLDTGEVLSTHQIEPDKTYWRNQNRKPGRWPSSPK